VNVLRKSTPKHIGSEGGHNDGTACMGLCWRDSRLPTMVALPVQPISMSEWPLRVLDMEKTPHVSPRAAKSLPFGLPSNLNRIERWPPRVKMAGMLCTWTWEGAAPQGSYRLAVWVPSHIEPFGDFGQEHANQDWVREARCQSRRQPARRPRPRAPSDLQWFPWIA
jgi:hypothetical protein